MKIEFKESAFSKFGKIDYKDLIETVCTKIFNMEDIEITIVENNNLLKKLSNEEIDIIAMSHNPFPNKFYIYTNGCADKIIICHELIHINQMYRGDLKISKDYKEIKWKNVKYDNNTPYDDRPWEKEAFGNQRKIWRQYKKLKNE